MLSPEKHLKVNEFARNLVNGIIFQEVKEDKIRPEVLKSAYFKHEMKHAIVKRVMDTALTQFSESPFTQGEGQAVPRAKQTERDNHLFLQSQTKDEFFQVAKQASRPHQLRSKKITNKAPMENFYNACFK